MPDEGICFFLLSHYHLLIFKIYKIKFDQICNFISNSENPGVVDGLVRADLVELRTEFVPI